jgi:hypothetical protein
MRQWCRFDAAGEQFTGQARDSDSIDTVVQGYVD